MAALSGNAIRRLILEHAYRAKVGHIGSALSIADLLAVLYGRVLRLDAPEGQRDRFILSKGHAALALYAALHLRGTIGEEELATYCRDGSRLGVHPESGVPGVDFSSGSLGHGLSIGVGFALSARLRGSGSRTFVLVSDAECNEGSLWEAVMFAAHHRLLNLVAVVDANGQQAFGHTRDVLSLEPLAERWHSFGWRAMETDGHDEVALEAALRSFEFSTGPSVLVAKTVFGRGVSYMESRIKWHYWPMSDDEYCQALAELAPG